MISLKKQFLCKSLWILGFMFVFFRVSAKDWPMWRFDVGRTAFSSEELPASLHLQWSRQYSAREEVWDDPLNRDLMPYDKVFEPIEVGGVLFVGFNDKDKVVAINSATGKELWSFYADGPVRLPLTWYNQNIYFTSDDGCLYCVSADRGQLKWKFRGGPSDRRILGNKRLISTWPARGGVVIAGNTAYFAASIWPFMGTFIYALDAGDGSLIWKNDGTGSDYIRQPHNAYSFAGIAPQGTMALNGDYLLVPGGRSVPGCFDRKTGELRYYHINKFNKSGGAFVATRGSYFVNHFRDRNTYIYRCKDGKRVSPVMGKYPVLGDNVFYFSGDTVTAINPAKPGEVIWSLPVDASGDLIRAGSRLYAGGKNKLTAIQIIEGQKPQVLWEMDVKGTIGRLIAANGRLFAVTQGGKILAFGGDTPGRKKEILSSEKMMKISKGAGQWATRLLKSVKTGAGYALWYGVDDPGRLAALAQKSQLSIIAVDGDAQKTDKLRRRFDAMGFSAGKVAFLQGSPENLDLAPYFSSITIIEDIGKYNRESISQILKKVHLTSHPFGGKIWIGGDETGLSLLAEMVRTSCLDGLVVESQSAHSLLLSRKGAPEGSANWTHQYGSIANTIKSDDKQVKLPLGVLWFGGNSNMDVLPRHAHGPSEQIMNGKLIIQGLRCLSARDVYTGRVLWKKEFKTLGNYGVYYNETYVDDPLTPKYNQEHIPGANSRGTNFIVTSDYIYLAQGTTCHVLDIETGETVKTMWMPNRDRCAYMGVSGKNLIRGANFAAFPAMVKKNLKSKEDMEVYLDILEATHKRNGSLYNYGLSASAGLVVADRYDLNPKWTTKAKYGFIHNGITANDSVIYVLDKLPAAMLNLLSRRGVELDGDFSLTAMNIETGDTLWQNRNHVFGSWLSYSKEYGILLQATRPSRDMLKGEPGNRMIAHRASDGKILWDRKINYFNPPILHGRRIIVENHAYDLTTGVIIDRVDPVTGEKEPWKYTRMYGCNYIIGSENLLSFRSGAAGFYDLKAEGGTGNLGGFKSGCTSNLIAANGVLNAPDYTRTCSCSYQNQTSLSFIYMPQLEYWTNNEFDWSGKPVRKLGINFGAPGDRVATDKTLWLDYPSVGGKSPDVPVKVKFVTTDSSLIRQHKALSNIPGEQKMGYIRTNSFNIERDDHMFVAASAINGVKEIKVTLSDEKMKDATYTVVLYFAEIEPGIRMERLFDVSIQGKKVLNDFDVEKEAGGKNRLITRTFKGVDVSDQLLIQFFPSNKEVLPLLNGIEVMREERHNFF